jgi:hypothetical protein
MKLTASDNRKRRHIIDINVSPIAIKPLRCFLGEHMSLVRAAVDEPRRVKVIPISVNENQVPRMSDIGG